MKKRVIWGSHQLFIYTSVTAHNLVMRHTQVQSEGH